jgi:trimethylamine--corrinoid protein Co-methyltransferase
MLTITHVPWSGAQYVHYAFGLLERTNIFCPEQAVLDNAHIGMVKHNLAPTTIAAERKQEILSLVREVMESDHKTYIYHLPLPTQEEVYMRYPLESEEGGALMAAHNRYKEISGLERKTLPSDLLKDIEKQVPGILPETLK